MLFQISQTYTDIDDDQLDSVIQDVLSTNPQTGYKRMKGFLYSRGVKVTTLRCLRALRRVDPIGVEIRRGQNRAIVRRQYFVTYSMEIWHIDTHHKLIR